MVEGHHSSFAVTKRNSSVIQDDTDNNQGGNYNTIE